MVLRSRLIPICLALAACLIGCAPADPPEWKKVLAQAGPTRPEAPKASPTSDDLVAYIDMSASMAGYVRPDGRNAFGRTLQEIRNVATTLEPPVSVVVRRIDARIGDPMPDTLLTKASIDRSLFDGAETNLSGTISAFSLPARGGQSIPARYHILVSDGVQSRDRDSADESCVAGSDQICVRKKILELLQKKWTGCVLCIRSPFDGMIYSEVNRKVKFKYSSDAASPRTFRPFYLYVFSPDGEALGKLVHALSSRLQPALGKEPLLVLPLTGPYAQGPAQASVTVPPESRELVEVATAQGQSPPGFTFRVGMKSERVGPRPISIQVKIPWTEMARMSGSPKHLAELLRWELSEVRGDWDKAGGRYPVLALRVPTVDAEGGPVVNATVQWEKGVGEPGWRVYRLEGKLDLREKTPSWVREWSTDLDTSPADGNRTLYLESQLLGLWANKTLQDKVVAEVVFRVGRI